MTPGDIVSGVIPSDMDFRVTDLESYLPAPRRKHGITCLQDQQSFVSVVKEHFVEGNTHIYADQKKYCVTAVLNGDGKPTDVSDGAAWGDYRAVLQLEKTPEWMHWEHLDGRMISQEEFAEHVEDGLLEIINPDSATMLELVQSFHASTNFNFKEQKILATGERQFTHDETITAMAGRNADLVIPSEIELAIKPFVGSEQPYKVTARFRFRLNGGKLTLGYKMNRPDVILRTAFQDTVSWIASDTSLAVLSGEPTKALN